MYVMHAPRDLDDFHIFSQYRISLNALVYVFSYQLTPPKISKWKKMRSLWFGFSLKCNTFSQVHPYFSLRIAAYIRYL